MKRINRMGVRSRVTLYLIAFVALIIAMLWVLQIVLLDDFYRWDKTRQVRQTSDIVVNNLDSSHLTQLLDRLASQGDTCILLLDSSGRTIASSDDIRFCLIHRMSSRDLSWWCSMAPEDGSVITELFNINPFAGAPQGEPPAFRGFTMRREIDNRQSLLCARRVTLAGGEEGYLLLNTIITPLDTTVNTLRSQLMMVTLVVMAGAIFLAMIISRRFTLPLIETNAAACALSHGQYDLPAHSGSYREIAELNQTLSLAARELSQVEHLQHELIANISHDLRTPLTMIGGYAEAMRDIPGESTPENMQIIIDETNRLTSLVNEVMDFSRLQAGQIPMEITSFCLTQSLEAIVSRISKLTEKDGYVIAFEPLQRIWVTADEKRISQVIYNLIGNALTYTGEDKRVFIEQLCLDSRVRIAIRDTGKGIAPEELPLIWKRYYRTKETHRRAIIGSGLGLSIVQSILEKHGVAYGVNSDAGQGTTFWFELPLAQEETSAT